MIHEMEHVIDLALGRHLEGTTASALRLEANAAIIEYQYIKMVFNLQDLEGLERNFPVLPQNLHERASELLDFPQHTNNGIFVEGLAVKEAIAGFTNSHFMAKVQAAFKVEQEAYVEAAVETYRILYKDGGFPPSSEE